MTALDSLRQYVEDAIARIEADSRFTAPLARVQINAPLALLQTDLKARHAALLSVLGRIDDEEAP